MITASRRPHRALVAVLLALVFALGAPAAQAGPGDEPGDPGVPDDEVLIQFSPELGDALLEQVLAGTPFESLPFTSTLKQVNLRHHAWSLEPLFDPKTSSPAALEAVRQANAAFIPPAAMAAPLPRLDHCFKLRIGGPMIARDAALEYLADADVLRAEEVRLVVGSVLDPLCNASGSWGVLKIGADLPGCGWDMTRGGARIAVIDSGADMDHPELQTQLIAGYDYVENDNVPEDETGHGTHVAGTIAAATENGLQVCSVAPMTKILVIRVLNQFNTGGTGDLAAAILEAVGSASRIINMSLGLRARGGMVELMVDYAHQQGVLVVSSAGNEDGDDACEFQPANCENSMAISATDPSDVRADFSNRGEKIDVGAPGVEIESTVLAGGVDFKDGTSMAAPHVSGAAGLVATLHPTWTNEQIKQVLRRSADDAGTPGFDLEIGFGRVSACNATLVTDAPPTAALNVPHNCATVSGSVDILGYADFPPGGQYLVQVGVGELPSSWTTIGGGPTPVMGGAPGLLATWDTTVACHGVNVVRVLSFGLAGSLPSEDRNLVNVENPYLTGTNGCASLHGVSGEQILGVVDCGGTGAYVVEYAPGVQPGAAAFQPILPTSSFPSQPAPGVIADWDTTGLADGAYLVRVTAACPCGGNQELFPVVIDRKLHPGWPVPVSGLGSFKSPAFADVDLDGRDDIVIGSMVLDVTGSPLPGGWDRNPGMGRTNSAVADLGHPSGRSVVSIEFCTYVASNPACPNDGAPVVMAYDAAKSVQWRHDVTRLGAPYFGTPSSVAIGDVTGDLRPDVVFTMTDTSAGVAWTDVFVLRGIDGGLQSRFSVTGSSLGSVALADLDADGDRDIVLAPRLPMFRCNVEARTWLGGSITGAWPAPINDCRTFFDPIVGDLENDGDLDVIVGRWAFGRNGIRLPGWPPSNPTMSNAAMGEAADGSCEQEVVQGPLVGSVAYRTHQHDASVIGTKRLDYGEVIAPPAPTFETDMQGNPIVVDVSGSASHEVVAPADVIVGSVSCPLQPLYSSAMSAPGPMAAGFPRWVSEPGGIIRSTPALGDPDGDGVADLALMAGDQVFLWSMGVQYSTGQARWPMFQHDAQRTGAQPLVPRPPVTEAWVSQVERSLVPPATVSDEVAMDVAVDAAGNSIVAGYGYSEGNMFRFMARQRSDGSLAFRVGGPGPSQWPAEMWNGVAVDAAGNGYVTGESYDGLGDKDCITEARAPDGSLLWSVVYDDLGTDAECEDIAWDGAEHVYVVATARTGSLREYVVVKHAITDGSIAWDRRQPVGVPVPVGSPATHAAVGIAVTPYDTVVVTGWVQKVVGALDKDVVTTFLYKSSGGHGGTHTWDGAASLDDWPASIEAASGHVVIAGTTRGVMTSLDGLALVYNSSAAFVRALVHDEGVGAPEQFKGAFRTAAGRIWCAGSHVGAGPTSDARVVQYDSSWAVACSGSVPDGIGPDSFVDVASDGAGGAYAAGFAAEGPSESDMLAASFASDCTLRWSARWSGADSPGGERREQAFAVAALPGEVWMAGTGWRTNDNDATTVKYEDCR